MNPLRHLLQRLGLAVLLQSGLSACARPATLSDPEVDGFNLRVGTQTFGPRYHFTTNTTLVETALAIRELGSDVIKFHLGRGFTRQYGITVPGTVTNLTLMARDEPSCRRVLDLPFRHVLLWTYGLTSSSDAPFLDGLSATERTREYTEVRDLARHLLTTYSGSDRSFYLGHWEGDWYLLPNYNTGTNPTQTAIRGMADWLNTRQQAVDDAVRETPHSRVHVYHYTEVNRVRDAMLNGPGSNQRLVNTVLPLVTNLDFVSWSSYDGMDLDATALRTTLDYIESKLPTAKAGLIPGRRVLIGEYGWGGTRGAVEQEPLTRAYLRRLLPWGPRFILFWEMYDNEGKAFSLIDGAGNRTPCHWLHQRFLGEARMAVARFHESHGRLPDDPEFAALATPLLDRPLSAPERLVVSNVGASEISVSSAVVTGAVTQGVYGDEAATVSVHWGPSDGGTNAAAWRHSAILGVNHRFNPSRLSIRLTDLPVGAETWFRFQAANSTARSWAPTPDHFTTPERP